MMMYLMAETGMMDGMMNLMENMMSVMMPMGVSVYETTDGQVKIAAMNLGLV